MATRPRQKAYSPKNSATKMAVVTKLARSREIVMLRADYTCGKNGFFPRAASQPRRVLVKYRHGFAILSPGISEARRAHLGQPGASDADIWPQRQIIRGHRPGARGQRPGDPDLRPARISAL